MRHRFLSLILFVAMTAALAAPVRAATDPKTEQRAILTLKASPFDTPHPPWMPSLFVAIENRYRDGIIHYQQFTLGIANRWTPWLSAALYTTPRQSNPKGGSPVWKNVHGAMALLSWKHERFTLINRDVLEWHVTDDFVRTRHLFEARVRMVRGLALFCQYEARFDADAERINMQTVAAGLFWRVRPQLALRLLVADEENRRGSAQWTSQYYLSLVLVLNL